MAREDILKSLERLIRLDLAASRLYERTIRSSGSTELATKLCSCRQDHERHIRELSGEMRKLGGTPPLRTPGMSEKKIHELTDVQSCEHALHEAYASAVKEEWTPELHHLIQAHFRDEQRHLECLQRLLENPSEGEEATLS